MHLTVATVLYNDTLAGSVGGVFVGPCSLAALEHHSIIVDVHIAPVNKDVGTNVDVESIARRCSATRIRGKDVLRGGEDVTTQVSHVVTTVEVVRPHGGVDKTHILNGDVAGVGDIHKSWALRILVGALRVPLTTNPELLPVRQSVAVNGSLAAYGETVNAVGIDEC